MTLTTLSSQILSAREIAGISIAETITTEHIPTPLILNGAGIRTKFFFDIYIGSLYLSKKSHDPSAIMALDTPKRVSMYFLYDEVSKEKLASSWTDGFKDNHDNAEYQKLKPELERFNALFDNIQKNDVLDLDYIPTQGTVVYHNKKLLGSIKSTGFYNALLKVWLGNDPADDDLKQAMLGILN
ncbi:MAG: hypothetical protein GXP08_06375 [Gammaproteobacteria bacterium]|nr:hypothetical protein [Gammaproteobacteria bacterium]